MQVQVLPALLWLLCLVVNHIARDAQIVETVLWILPAAIEADQDFSRLPSYAKPTLSEPGAEHPVY